MGWGVFWIGDVRGITEEGGDEGGERSRSGGFAESGNHRGIYT